ncbi:MAG: alpha/beta hydrolase [Acholeplasmataceae bacterium]|nr:alpha/beta hydrolase [Acholeplasmataceae bacterium]
MITYEKHSIKLLNGETLFYIEKGTGPKTILLIHGNLTSSVHMVTLMDELKESYRVIAPDLRGFGDSSYNNEFRSLKELAQDLVLFCHELKIDEAHVVGWSTGFGVAMELAIINPSLVKSLFSLEGMSVKGYYSRGRNMPTFNSYLDMSNNPIMRSMPDVLESKDYQKVKYVWENTLLIKTKLEEDLIDLYVKETLKQRCLMNINWCWVNFNLSDEPNLYVKGNGQMHLIKCPVYITKGMIDNVVTPDMIDENITRLKNVKVFEFKEGSHCLHYDELESILKLIKTHL